MHTHTRTHTTVLQLSGFLQDNPIEPVPEETFIHSHLSWSSVIPYLLSPSIAIHGICPDQFTCLTVFSIISLQVLFDLPLGLAPSIYASYISSPNNHSFFAAHAHTIATCFAVVPRLYHLIPVCLSTLLGILSCSFTPHIHLTILISAR